MLRRTLVALAFLFATACGGGDTTPEAPSEPTAEAAPEPTPEETPEATPVPKSQYAVAAEKLVAAIDEGKPPTEIEAMADGLTKLGLQQIARMRAKHSVCGPYFDALVAVALTLKDLPLEEIESGYHADGKLPELPDGVCYHGKDLVVHPATVAALAKKGLADDESRAAAKAEITEVLSHLDAVEAAVKSED